MKTGEGRTYQEEGVSRAGQDGSRMCSVLQRHPGESRRAGALGSLAPWWEREEMCSENRTHKCKHTCQRAKELRAVCKESEEFGRGGGGGALVAWGDGGGQGFQQGEAGKQ